MCLVQFYILREHKSSIFKSSVLLSVCQLKDSDLYVIPSMWFISQSGLDVRDMWNLYYLYLCQIFFCPCVKVCCPSDPSGLCDSESPFLFGKHALPAPLLQLSSGKAYLIKCYSYSVFFKDCLCNHWTWIGGWGSPWKL